MNALRSIAFMLWMTVTVIPWGTLSFLAALLPQPRRYLAIAGWTDVAVWGARHIMGIRYEVHGLENIPDPQKHGGVIFLSKHQSRYETLLFRSLFRRMCYVYKRELHWVPFFGWGIFLCSMVPINRAKGADAMEQVIETGGAKLKSGWNMVLFPEGTRVDPGTQKRYKQGGTRLSTATGVPVVPIAHNGGDVWPRGRWVKKPGLVKVFIGAPIAPGNMTAEEQMARVETWIEHTMREQFPHQYAATKSPQ